LFFYLGKAKKGQDLAELTRRIRETTGWRLNASGVQDLTLNILCTTRDIPINFGTFGTFGFIVGAAIAARTFYNFTLGNLLQFGDTKSYGDQQLDLAAA